MDGAIKGIIVYTGLMIVVPLFLYFILPDPVPTGGRPTDEERQRVQATVSAAVEAHADLQTRRITANRNRVVEVRATWTGDVVPSRDDREGWTALARGIAEELLDAAESGWHINVALYHDGLPFGVGGAAESIEGEGEPAVGAPGRAPDTP